MKNINKKNLDSVLASIGKQLSGNWVLLGGSLLTALGIQTCVTEDIDIAKVGGGTQNDLLDLLNIAQSLALPVETINQAAAFFLQKIPRWQSMLVPLYKGKRAVILRPNVTLFLLLKIARMSESDLLDCIQFIKYAIEIDEKIDRKKIHSSIEKISKDASTSSDKIKRFNKLLTYLD